MSQPPHIPSSAADTVTTGAPAILFLIFNRPNKTREVFDAIRRQRPARLYIAADGPRSDHPEDADRCAKTRQILDEIDWDCTVQTLPRDRNLGCRNAVSSAIDWFFEHEEEGIILEDDCLPHPSFFAFTATLLSHYRNEPRIMMISGTRLLPTPSQSNHGYDFTRIPSIWGWATWRRAWRHYDVDMKSLPAFLRDGGLHGISNDTDIRNHWIHCLIPTYQKKIDTWDYQWLFCMLQQGAFGICPALNLVRNTGLDGDSTHHHNPGLAASTNDVHSVTITGHPDHITANPCADLEVYRCHMDVKHDSFRNPLLRLRRRISRRMKYRRMLRRFLAGAAPSP